MDYLGWGDSFDVQRCAGRLRSYLGQDVELERLTLVKKQEYNIILLDRKSNSRDNNHYATGETNKF